MWVKNVKKKNEEGKVERGERAKEIPRGLTLVKKINKISKYTNKNRKIRNFLFDQERGCLFQKTLNILFKGNAKYYFILGSLYKKKKRNGKKT